MTNFVDIVDEKDNIIDRMTDIESDNIKDDVGLRRASVVFVLNSRGQILLQKRSKKKYRYPLYWGISVGGLVDSGDDYLKTAIKESEEEIGIKIKPENLIFLGKQIIKTNIREFISAYKYVFDGKIKIDNDEVCDARFFTKSEIKEMIKNKEKLTPVLIGLFEKFF